MIRLSAKLSGGTEVVAIHKSGNDKPILYLEIQNFANGWFAGKTMDDDIRYGGVDAIYKPRDMDSN